MKLLIVDDEVRTRELLRNYIPWEELGISEVETARNGQLALHFALEWHPDIVLCDVRMPKLNGIEFTQQYRPANPKCKIIFLSGYSDKEYLKSAIHLNALTYLEKPVNLDEVRLAVENAIALRQEEREREAEAMQLQAEVDRSLPFVRQEMVRKLISNPSSEHVEPALRSQETFLLPLHGPYTIAVASLYWNPPEHPEDPSSVQERILDSIGRNPLTGAYRLLAGFDACAHLALVLPGAYGSTYRDGRDTMESIYAELRAMAGVGIELRMGVSDPVQALLSIPAAYKQASQACAYQYYGTGGKLVFPDSLGSHRSIETDWDEVRLLREHVRKGQVNEARSIIKRWTTYARACVDLDLMRLKDTYFQFLVAITETAIQLGYEEQSNDTERRYMWKEIDRVPSLDELEAYVLTILDVYDEGARGDDGLGAGKLREVIRYIHAHFHEKGFTIKSIADHVQLTETYLCAYFKKQRGQTIKEFITEVRMNKAMELLRDMNMKLFEVAIQLGFADANYFTTFFKRYAGCTPSEYRERNAK